MKWFFKSKDGGSESTVTGYWLVEAKSLGSIVLLRFDEGSRDAYHNHAFNCVSWVLRGVLHEECIDSHGDIVEENLYESSLKPVFTWRDTFHQVNGLAKHTWVLSFRGPWSQTWEEYLPGTQESVTLTNGRVRA